MKTDRRTKEVDWERVSQTVETHQAKLIRYATSIVRDEDRAKDIAQEAFIRLCRASWPDVEGHLQAWLFRVTRNLALDVLRKEKRMSYLSEAESIEGLAQEGEEGSRERARMQDASSLLELVKALPRKQAEVVLLKFQQDLSYKEISEVTGLSVSNVGYLMHHALKELKSLWQAGEVR